MTLESPNINYTPAMIWQAQGGVLPVDPRKQPIDYIDPAPKPFVVQIPLVEYFERIKRHKADRWQQDFCNRLEKAAVEQHEHQTSSITHAEGQLGKSSILAQVYPAWRIGHNPLHRAALATYNVTRSQRHSKTVIGIMNLPIHKAIFTNPDGWVKESASKEKWSTEARLQLNDGQDSFNPVGLQSGLTGSGFDDLIIDDPYADQKEAFSETVRQNLQDFWEFTVMSRIGTYSNVFGMFHRYHVEDLAGYLLDTGDFDYWRYATICDGDYIHESTGKRYPDPIGRQVGEYISERRSPSYYDKARKNPRVFNSMFQGKPTTDEGDFFKVGQIGTLTPDEGKQRRNECSIMIRGWDLAATDDGGDYSVGTLLGASIDGRVTVFDIVREQVDTAGRDALQKKTAIKDGPGVVITVPNDPGAGGTSSVYYIQQNLKGFDVVPRSTSGSKEDRARPFAGTVGEGLVDFVSDEDYIDEKKWIKAAKREMRNFGLSDHDDIVDSASDAYNEAFERVTKGLVVKNFYQQRNLITFDQFRTKYPYNNNGTKDAFRIPAAWTIYVGVKITPDASMPNSAVIVAQASENADIDAALFVVAEYKEYTADFYELFTWIDRALKAYCANPQTALIWLHKDSETYLPTIKQKLDYGARMFKGDALAGLTEANWYLKPLETQNPFNATEKAARLYGLVADPLQISVATNSDGLYAIRQEAATWGFDKNNEPNGVGAVLDCLRMVTHKFRTRSVERTFEEKVKQMIPAETIAAVANATTSMERLQSGLVYEFEREFAESQLMPVDVEEEWEAYG